MEFVVVVFCWCVFCVVVVCACMPNAPVMSYVCGLYLNACKFHLVKFAKNLLVNVQLGSIYIFVQLGYT